MDNQEKPKWRNVYETLKPEDHDQLEANSAINEFRGGLPKEEAESKAHQDYLKNHAMDSAAFHYIGMRAATAAQHEPAAKKHGAAYSLAMKHLGLNPLDAPPKEILDRVKDVEKSPYKFSPHSADEFFVPKMPQLPEPTEEQKTLELVEKLKSMRTNSPK